ncbi:RagB/SusD family nutrient uptake outer membrane protein [uncultured Parabacteroides sp.]|uniref:RagB/SusD family nutrient uptake outer membrane protein n=1 Tax=uncultured Parabacteroides sp. TaxID=512312 RepID=UPI00261A62E2|nr:RagB/SusD family nutrient uptake outer membrane protein [uncultured Parabacteroides sp.]
MKKILSILYASTLMLSSCDGFLDEELKNAMAPDNTYTSTHGFEVGVTGLYEFARSEWTCWGDSNDPSFAHGGATPYEVLQIGMDIANTGHNDGALQNFDNLSYTPSSPFIKSFWDFGYRLAANANQILTYSENENVKWDHATDKIGYQAEARFFRAYAYYYLVYLYGDVPYTDKIEYDFRTDFTRTPKAEVINKMLEDLEFASANLPEDPDKVEPGRLTKWAAEHLMADICLLGNKPAEAEKHALNVINSGYFQLMTQRFGKHLDQPGDVFSDMFKENNQNRTSGNKESIWVMQLEYNTIGGGFESEDWRIRVWTPKYWQIDGFVIADSLGGRGLAQLMPLPWWITSENFFDESDIRNSEYNIKRHWYCNDASSEKYGEYTPVTESLWKAGRLSPAITKFFYGVQDKGGSEGFGGSMKDRMKFRLADTYLLLAEARIAQNNMQGAAEAFNVVRARANAKPVTAAQINVDFLLDERIREMIGEECRRFTLSRFPEKFMERTLKYNDRASMEQKHLLWPIPQNVIDSNSSAELPQNPGWDK